MNKIANHFRSVQFSSWIWLIFLLILSSWSWVIVAHIFGLVQFIFSSFKFIQIREKESLFFTQKPFLFLFWRLLFWKITSQQQTFDSWPKNLKFILDFPTFIQKNNVYLRLACDRELNVSELGSHIWKLKSSWSWVNVAHILSKWTWVIVAHEKCELSHLYFFVIVITY